MLKGDVGLALISPFFADSSSTVPIAKAAYAVSLPLLAPPSATRACSVESDTPEDDNASLDTNFSVGRPGLLGLRDPPD